MNRLQIKRNAQWSSFVYEIDEINNLRHHGNEIALFIHSTIAN
ncbi:MAG: hypothetical protein QX194_01515 [Methylococcales bacterium]